MIKGFFELKSQSDNIYIAYTEGVFTENMYENLIEKSESLIKSLNPNGYVLSLIHI